MKVAVDVMGGVMGCQAAYVEVNPVNASDASNRKSMWKGITKISDIELR